MDIRLRKLGIPAAVIALCGFGWAQPPQNVQLVSANAQLSQNVDSRNVKEGDVVTAKLTSDVKDGGRVELPKGAVLVGKVEKVQKNELTLVFDEAKLRDGKTVPVKTTLLSAYSPDATQMFAQTGNSGSLVPQQPHAIPADEKTDQAPGLLGNVALHSDAASDASGVFTSTGRNVNLKRGTEFQVAIAPQGPQAVANGQ